jgi:hypothetical protein
MESPPQGGSPTGETVEQILACKAAARRAGTCWTSSATEIQRSRLAAGNLQPHNLPLPEFALLAHKSRQQIYKDITARRLLALNVGRRGQSSPIGSLIQ